MSSALLTPIPKPPTVDLTYVSAENPAAGPLVSRRLVSGWAFSAVAYNQLYVRSVPLDECVAEIDKALEQGLEAVPYCVQNTSKSLRNCFVDINGRACVALVNPKTRVIVTVVPQVAPREEYAKRLVEVRERHRNPFYSRTPQELRHDILMACSSNLGFSRSVMPNGTSISHPAIDGSIHVPREMNPDLYRSIVSEIEDLTGIGLNLA